MAVDLKSDWQTSQVELLKTLHEFREEGINRDVGSVDYVAEDDEGKKLLRVMIYDELRGYKADLEAMKKTVGALEEGRYDEVIVVAKRFTSSAKRMANLERSVQYASPKSRLPVTVTDLAFAIQKKVCEICETRCGGVPTSEEDCNGYVNGEYTCPARRISDDADFHAERNWIPLLKQDFDKLIEYQQELN